MSKSKAQPKRAKPGSNRASAAQRRKEFVSAYLGNGRNALQAAITAGYSAKSAGVTGSKLLKHPKVKPLIEAAGERSFGKLAVSADRTLREIARCAYADIRNLYYADGTLKPLTELDDDTAATVASVESVDLPDGGGRANRVKMWDKLGALREIAKIQQLYATEPPVKEVEPTNDLEIARRIWFVLDRPLRKRTVETERLEAPEQDG